MKYNVFSKKARIVKRNGRWFCFGKGAIGGGINMELAYDDWFSRVRINHIPKKKSGFWSSVFKFLGVKK